MAEAKPIEIPVDVLWDVMSWNRKHRRFFYTSDKRIPDKWHGKPVSRDLRTTLYNESGNLRSKPKQYYSLRLCKIDGVKYRPYLEHRLLTYYLDGQQPAPVMDHNDDDKLNNNPHNLVPSTDKHNSTKHKRASPCADRFVGGSYDKRQNIWRFKAVLTENNQTYHGAFTRDADKAVLEAAQMCMAIRGPSRTPERYINLLHTKGLYTSMLGHFHAGTLPAFVKKGHNRKSKRARKN